MSLLTIFQQNLPWTSLLSRCTCPPFQQATNSTLHIWTAGSIAPGVSKGFYRPSRNHPGTHEKWLLKWFCTYPLWQEMTISHVNSQS